MTKILEKINLQRLIYSCAFITGVLFFAYSLIFSTDLYALANVDDPTSFSYVPGAEVYNLAQPFNKLLLTLSVIHILAGIAPLVFFSSSRRLFYKSNYISSGVFIGYTLFMAVFTAIHVVFFRSEFLKVDFAKFKDVVEITNGKYVDRTLFFDIGFAVVAFAVLSAAAVAFVCVAKLLISRDEARSSSLEVQA